MVLGGFTLFFVGFQPVPSCIVASFKGIRDFLISDSPSDVH